MREFDNAVRPDLGGTRYNIWREISPDKIAFHSVEGGYLKTLTIIDHKSFLKVDVETARSGKFLEVFYDCMGDIISANIWFRRYCMQDGFKENAFADPDFTKNLRELTVTATDIVFEAEVATHLLGLYRCMEKGDADHLKVVNNIGVEIIPPSFEEALSFRFNYLDSKPIKFIARSADNVLSLGFFTNPERWVSDSVSTVVDFEELGESAKPDMVKNVFDKIFVKS